MSVLKSFCIAFSMYSKIPMPQFEWRAEDMKYSLCFFPWVGAVIGVLEWIWYLAAEKFGIGMLAFALVGAAIPLLVTGGFHVDGFLDTMDALHSYQPREKKLEILKDAHIGAFAVIMLALYLLLWVAGFSEILSKEARACMCGGFFLSRVLSGMTLVWFPAAKKEGTLVAFADTAHKKAVRAVLAVQAFLGAGLLMFWDLKTAVLLISAMLLFLGYYYWRCKREFGGITGDTAGYFVTICELLAVAAAVAGSRW